LKIRKVTVRYGDKTAINKASLEVKSKEIVGFIGADGAGKSSLMYAISGVKKFEGEIFYENFSYRSPKEAERIKRFIGFMPQGIGLVLYPKLSVWEHLEFFAKIRGVKEDGKHREYVEKLLRMAGLSEFKNRLAENLSGGMMQKLSLICTLVHKPKILILDEPTTGVDPLSRRELWNILDENRKEEDSLALVSTAYMGEAYKMDRIFLFDEGEIIAKGEAEALTDSVREYTYEETFCESGECITFNKRTYSLSPLNAPHSTPSLESLFFVNALKKGKIPPEIEIEEREEKKEIPQVIMRAVSLTKRFGNFVANDRIDMQLKRGEILGLIGANGAGKTTFIKTLLGLYRIDGGELYLLGKKIKSPEDRRELKSKIGYMSQRFSLYKEMTIRENLLYFANMHGLDMKKAVRRIKRLSKSLGFSEYMERFPNEVPLGIKQRFSLTAAILHEPVVLFLDEPTSGVDAIARARFWDLLHRLKRKWNISVLITTHYMSEAEYCDRVVLLKEGRKIADDKVEKLYEKFPGASSFEDIFLQFYKRED